MSGKENFGKFRHPATTLLLIFAREKLTVCDVTNLPYDNTFPYMVIGYFVTSLTAYYSCADINMYKLKYFYTLSDQVLAG